MKVGLVCPYNIAKGGGVQEIVRAMRSELEARGHTAKIITPQPRDISNCDTEGVIFVGGGTDFRSPLHTTAHLSASVDTEALEQMLESEQFDILHFHEPWVPMISRQILSRSKSVNIATFHAKVPETLMSRTVVKVVTPYTKSVLKYLHELTAVSDAAAEYIGSLTDQPVTIIPNAIDLKKFKPGHKTSIAPKGTKTILYIGRLERRKGVKHLLKAYAIYAQTHPETALIIAGDGPDREKLELMVEDYELSNVTFTGYISDEVKMELLHSADLFCSPAIYGESFGIVLLEAMACGLVTIAGNNSGYSSVMQEMGGISLVNPEDHVEFARRIDLLLNESTLRDSWKAWAKQYVKQYGYPQIIDQYEALYKEALAHNAVETAKT
jgi:phosphatidylinositol alpha-mannosyltransferase